jgi:hypothetical protein
MVHTRKSHQQIFTPTYQLAMAAADYYQYCYFDYRDFLVHWSVLSSPWLTWFDNLCHGAIVVVVFFVELRATTNVVVSL